MSAPRHGKKGRKGKDRAVSGLKRTMKHPDRVFSLEGSTMPQANLYSPDGAVFMVTQSNALASFLTASNTVTAFGNFAFQLNQVDQYASFQQVFDQYRVDWIECWLVPRVGTNTNNAANFGLLVSCIDYDDSNNLASYQAGCDYNNALQSSGLNGHYRKFKPRMAVAAYAGTFTSYGNQRSWVDTSYPAVYWYGMKTAITAAGATPTFDLQWRALISFRCVR